MAVTGLPGLRKNAAPGGLTQRRTAQLLGVSLRTYYRYEANGNVPTDRRDALAAILEVSRGQLDAALPDHDGLNGLTIPVTQGLYISLEQGASRLMAFQPWTVHALLQTQAYAAAVERTDVRPSTDDVIARRVELRMTRQRVLYRDLALSVILDESVLCRTTGGADVMAAQLAHLVEVAELPNVDIRVLPLATGVHLPSMRSFSLVTTAGAAQPQVLCVPDGVVIRYEEDPDKVGAHRETFAHLRSLSLSATESVAIIERTQKERYT